MTNNKIVRVGACPEFVRGVIVPEKWWIKTPEMGEKILNA